MAEFREPVKWLLFFSSYIPLYPILALKHGLGYDQFSLQGITVSSTVISAFWICLTLVSLAALVVANWQFKREELNDRIQIESYRSRNDLITSYMLVYIFPFVILDYSMWINWVAFVTFFLVIGVIQVRSNLLHVNPILALFRYDIYEVDDGNRELILITKQEIETDSDSIGTTKMTKGIYVIP